MNIEEIVIISAGGAVALVTGALVYRRLPKKLKPTKFETKWKELQLFCRDKATWAEAIIAADKLLDEALRKRKFRGKSMGERMVSAQKLFSNHDHVWYAHNIRKKIEGDPSMKLKEDDVKNALVAIRQALRDLGALPNEKSKES